MDWGTSDYTQTYADTLFVAEPESYSGVSILEEVVPEPQYRRPVDAYLPVNGQRQAWQGNSPNEGFRASRRAGMAKTQEGGRAQPPAQQRQPRKEGYYTGGNIHNDIGISRVENVNWDPRPMHYNPNGGADSAHLVPSPQLRPYGGGPAPSLAFPTDVTTSEAMMDARDSRYPSGVSREGFSVSGIAKQFTQMQIIELVLFFIILVMLGVLFMRESQLDKKYQALLMASLVRGTSGT